MSLIRRLLPRNYIADIRKLALRTFSMTVHNEVDNNILRSDSSDVVIPDITIQELAYPKMEQFHKYTAIECAASGRSYTYEQLRIKCRNLSKALRKKLNLEREDVVAICIPNCPEYPISCFGILEAGLVVSTISPSFTADEMSRQLMDCSAKAVITTTNYYDTIKSALFLSKQKLPIICIKEEEGASLPEGAISFDEFVNSKIDIPDIAPGRASDLAFLPYSSGTTGLPKGVELTHSNLVSNLCQANHPDFSFLSQPSDSFQEITPGILPMYHIYGFSVTLLNNIYTGGKIISVRTFTPELCISTLKNHKITAIYAAPPLVMFLTSHKDVKPEYFKHLKILSSGAAPLGFLDEERFIEKIGKSVKINQGYGMTETSPIVTYSPKVMKRNTNNGGSIGKPVPNTLCKVVPPDNPTANGLGPNQSGELLVKGPQVMRRYHNRPEETENIFANGWLRTGDLVRYNEEGLLFVTDRLKELIKVKGFQVAPAELEEIIRDHPSVEDAAVIGIPHPQSGEVPRAYVVPKKDKQLTLKDLNEYVNSKVAKYKRLDGGINIVESIPKNPSGKILRRQLKQEYQEKGI